ncbi:MAG TPA: LpqN/LpqT family lipoprotein [Mycobacterium sp.]|jgi:hypothetical protein
MIQPRQAAADRMENRVKNPSVAISISIAVISLAVALTGCGSGSKSAKHSSSAPTSTTTSTAPTPTPAQGAPQTVDDYIKQHNIQATTISHNTPGAPTIDLPVPTGWTLLPESDDAPYGGIVFDTPTDPNDPPKIIAVLRKLTGNVNTDELFAAIPGKVKRRPGFDGGDGHKGTLAGFPAYEIGGTAQQDGKPQLVAQKSVVIQVNDGVYLLQLNASGPEPDASALFDATKEIDDKTKITV